MGTKVEVVANISDILGDDFAVAVCIFDNFRIMFEVRIRLGFFHL